MSVATKTYLREPTNRDLSMIPGDFGKPLIGQTFEFIDDNVKQMLGNYNKYGPVFRLSLAFQNIVATVGPEFVEASYARSGQSVLFSQAGWEDMVGEFFQEA